MAHGAPPVHAWRSLTGWGLQITALSVWSLRRSPQGRARGVTSWLQMIPELIQSTCITRALASHSGGAGLPDRPSVAILHPVSPVFES